MSHNFRVLLAVAVVAFGASLLTTSTHAYDDDDDGWKDQREAWEDHHKSLRRQNRYHRSGVHWQPGATWHGTHGGYGAGPYDPYCPSHYGQPWSGYGVTPFERPWYGLGAPRHDYGHPYYGSSFYGYGGGGYFGRRRSGFFLQIR